MTSGPSALLANERLHMNIRAKELRDIADRDYIAARALYRCLLMDQFYWSGLQAFEKYLKSILLLHGKSAKEYSHGFTTIVSSLENETFVDFELHTAELQFLKRVEQFGVDRYVDSYAWSVGDELIWLDRTVWAVRRWCQTPTWTLSNGQTVTIADRLVRAKHADSEHKFKLSGGYLEKLLKRPTTGSHKSQRAALIWNNMYFGLRTRHSVTIPAMSQYRQAHHDRDPAAKDALRSKIRLPRT